MKFLAGFVLGSLSWFGVYWLINRDNDDTAADEPDNQMTAGTDGLFMSAEVDDNPRATFSFATRTSEMK